jgi:hypothetical protein
MDLSARMSSRCHPLARLVGGVGVLLDEFAQFRRRSLEASGDREQS